MSPALVQRQAALAGVALLAALGVVAFGPKTTQASPAASDVTGAAPVSWYEAVAGSYGPGMFGRQTACGIELTRETRGLAHPVLPCGVKILVEYDGRVAETRVVDRGPYTAGHEFDLTAALARDLGVRGIQTVRWRFAE